MTDRPTIDPLLAKGLLFLSSVVAAAVAVYGIVNDPHADQSWVVEVTAVCCAWLAAYFVISYLYLRTGYLFSSFYVLVLLFFHLSQPIAVAFGWDPGSLKSFDISSKWLELSAWYVILSLACFGIGFAISLRRRTAAEGHDPAQSWHRTGAVLFKDGLALLVISAGFLLLAIATVGNLLVFSRADLFRGVGD